MRGDRRGDEGFQAGFRDTSSVAADRTVELLNETEDLEDCVFHFGFLLDALAEALHSLDGTLYAIIVAIHRSAEPHELETVSERGERFLGIAEDDVGGAESLEALEFLVGRSVRGFEATAIAHVKHGALFGGGVD